MATSRSVILYTVTEVAVDVEASRAATRTIQYRVKLPRPPLKELTERQLIAYIKRQREYAYKALFLLIELEGGETEQGVPSALRVRVVIQGIVTTHQGFTESAKLEPIQLGAVYGDDACFGLNDTPLT